MKELGELRPDETTGLEWHRIEALIDERGLYSAERLIGWSIEEIDRHAAAAREAVAAGNARTLSRSLRRLAKVADDIGLSIIARVAGDVLHAAGNHDGPATGATLARLERLCDGAVPAIGKAWTSQP
jgi:hypothetical protein